MSQYVETGLRAFTAGAAIDRYIRVKLSSAKLAIAGVGDVDLGVIEEEAFADGDIRSVRLRTAQGTCKMVAAAAIAADATVYAAAAGKVDDVVSDVPIGTALEAAAAAGDIIEVLRFDAGGLKVVRGETALDGANPTPVATGLTTVVAFTATLKGTAAPGLGTSMLTANIAGAAGNVDVYAWKPTGAADTTKIASTGTETFYWVAVGT